MHQWLSVVAVAVLTLVGCGKPSAADQQAALEAVRLNVQAMERGNVDEVLATVHPKSPGFDETRKLLENLFGRFQLGVELEELAMESLTGDSVRAHFVQVTEKVSGDDPFQKNRLKGVHTLKKDGAVWKLWHTEVREVEPL
jgi:hypothetical protein